ncbi:MAG TPA: hypothetical protein VIW68_00995 [Candidatus Sulfotelmatobacter sp.]
MEALTRLVAESLARHGFDRPIDYRRLQWSRWFRCESPHDLLFVPSKPGVFALAEEVMTFGDDKGRDAGKSYVGTAASAVQPGRSPAAEPATAAERRMLAVLQFGEDDDMAFVLDRMFSRENPLRARLASGRCFVRFVVIEDETHRRSIATALNQWLVSSGEKASGIGAHFATSLELAPLTARMAEVARGEMQTRVGAGDSPAQPAATALAPDPTLDSGSNTNIHCPQPFPSGF